MQVGLVRSNAFESLSEMNASRSELMSDRHTLILNSLQMGCFEIEDEFSEVSLT